MGEVTPRALPLAVAGVREQMQYKVRTPEGREVYRWRKAIAEPVFGQTKACRGFRRFALRGLTNVSAEWLLISLTHNVLKVRWTQDGDAALRAPHRSALAFSPIDS